MNNIFKGLAFILALGLGFFAKDIYQTVQISLANKELKSDIEYCQLSTTVCTINDASIVLEQDVVSPMQPTSIEVTWPDNNDEQLWIELEGKEMSMGVAKFVLSNQGNNTFSGSLLLPVCHSDAMTWIGSIQSSNGTLPISVRMQR
ncbi:hypothetical protein AB4152_18655 [Vibrio breoganii]|uniref:hypothetical protein n=1 Tax=Vibrio breoganii TaxID=553239 RepID=UPI00080ED2BF|nr:hypothetical protein [Vibrio breoganii]OCH77700.1 hypothetical protein A6D95_05740 [Vibrio breoganii]PMI23740.1 hypothetical protein BCU49_17690 [Vibrio breoganii]PML20671.1 hypothetical protein BCT82_17260 [Vibrio breoganii]TKG24921.1 hypothetical protein FCV87_17650 [Vibrio breoganii]